MLGRRSLTAVALQPGCSIMRASLSVAPMVSLPSVLSAFWALPCPALVKPHTYGSLCRCAATGHRPAVSLRCAAHRFGLRASAHRAKGRASQIFDLSRAIPPQRAELAGRGTRTASPPASLRATYGRCERARLASAGALQPGRSGRLCFPPVGGDYALLRIRSFSVLVEQQPTSISP